MEGLSPKKIFKILTLVNCSYTLNLKDVLKPIIGLENL